MVCGNCTPAVPSAALLRPAYPLADRADYSGTQKRAVLCPPCTRKLAESARSGRPGPSTSDGTNTHAQPWTTAIGDLLVLAAAVINLAAAIQSRPGKDRRRKRR